jgi:hypothetical protein
MFIFHTTISSTTEEQDFLIENGEREEVITLPSGLQYEILRSGIEGPEGKTPGPYTPCVCQYKGTLLDGTVFDSSYDRGKPATFAPNQVIPAWSEALQLMRKGDKWKLFVPSKLGYGDRGAGKTIKPGATLIFELDLIEIKHGENMYWYTNLPLIGTLTSPLSDGSSITYGHVAFFMILIFYYSKKSNNSTNTRKVAARHILVKDLSVATLLKKQINNKIVNFEKAAAEHSICPSKKQGGFLGEFTAGQMVPQFDKVVWEAKVGDLEGPIQTQYGYHLIRVDRRDPPVVVKPTGPRPPEVEYKPGKFNDKLKKGLAMKQKTNESADATIKEVKKDK